MRSLKVMNRYEIEGGGNTKNGQAEVAFVALHHHVY